MMLTLSILATLARNNFNLTQRFAKAQRDAKIRFQCKDVLTLAILATLVGNNFNFTQRYLKY